MRTGSRPFSASPSTARFLLGVLMAPVVAFADPPIFPAEHVDRTEAPPPTAVWGRAPYVCDPGRCTADEALTVRALEGMADARWRSCGGRFGVPFAMMEDCHHEATHEVARNNCYRSVFAHVHQCQRSTNELFVALTRRYVPSLTRALAPPASTAPAAPPEYAPSHPTRCAL